MSMIEKIMEALGFFIAKYSVEPDYVILGINPYEELKAEEFKHGILDGYEINPKERTMETFTGMEVFRTSRPHEIAFGISVYAHKED